jgi:uncharacterized protein DUF3443
MKMSDPTFQEIPKVGRPSPNGLGRPSAGRGRAAKLFGSLFLLAWFGLSCGGGSSSSNPTGPPPTGNNSVTISVDGGPINPSTGLQTDYANGAFANVTVCQPGTATCQTIDHVIVDTGSYGLRILSSGTVPGGELTLALNRQTNGSGAVIVECRKFGSGLTWGPVATADIKISGETAPSVPIQIIGDPIYPDTTIPAACSNSGLPANDTLGGKNGLGAYGILGVGTFTNDCGGFCETTAANGQYFACPTPSTCVGTAEVQASQLQNPVALFSADNNGVLITLPPVPSGGVPSATGTLTFGIGTESNNVLGSATVFPVDSSGNFTTEYKSVSYGTNGIANSMSYIDSGSSAIFYLDPATTGFPDCGGSFTGFYCPPSTQAQTATTIGATGSPSSVVNFQVSNTVTIFNNNSGNNSAFSDFAGELTDTVDWGLPFFYGRTVFTAIEGRATPGGTGPYWAF